MRKLLISLLLISLILVSASCGSSSDSKQTVPSETSERSETSESKGSSTGTALSESQPVTEIITSAATDTETSAVPPAGKPWTLSSDGTLTVYESIVMSDDPAEQIPWSSKKEKIKKVIIKSGVASIGYHAFDGCKFLKSIEADEDNDTFSSLDGVLYDKDKSTVICAPAGKDLSAYIIPESVTALADSSFYFCKSLTSITIPSGVTSIGNYAFLGCSALKSVSIPEGVTAIGDWAFLDCASLSEITIPDSVTSLGCGPVSGTLVYSDNERRENGALYLGNHLISADYEIEGEFAIREGTITIAGMAFSGCASLSGITIPESVSYIGDNAFSGCASLTEIKIPGSVKTIGRYAFSGCESLTDVTVDESNTSFSSSDGVLFDKEKSCLLCFPSGNASASYNVPDGVTAISDNAFSFCALESVSLPASVKMIGDSAFYDCESLGEVILSDGLTSIGSIAFYSCVSLKNIIIPDSVVSIGDYAFSECASDLVITCREGSYAEQYAIDNGIRCSTQQ